MTRHDENGPGRHHRPVRLMTAGGCLLALALAACSGGGSSGAGGTGATAKVARGGVYRTAVSSFGLTNNLDPVGETQIGFAFSIYDAMLRNLVTFPHAGGAAGTQVVPDLATSVPAPTDHGLTYTFHLKSGIKFAPPVNREITSSDIAYAFQRINDAKLVAQYGYYYDGLIKGMTGKATSPDNHISGISTPNPTTIIFHLTKQAGDFLQRLASPAAAPSRPRSPSASTRRAATAATWWPPAPTCSRGRPRWTRRAARRSSPCPASTPPPTSPWCAIPTTCSPRTAPGPTTSTASRSPLTPTSPTSSPGCRRASSTGR